MMEGQQQQQGGQTRSDHAERRRKQNQRKQQRQQAARAPATAAARRPCMFGANCRKKETCPFDHRDTTTTTANNNNSKDPCRYGLQCHRETCRFSHPPGWNANKKTNNNFRHQRRNQPTTATTASNSNISSDVLDIGCYSGPLRPVESNGYKAAGILVLRLRHRPPPSHPHCCYYESVAETTETNESSSAADTYSNNSNNNQAVVVQMLLCAEVRKKKKTAPRGDLQLNFLGGKVEPDLDQRDSRVTAAREFWEETGAILSEQACQQLVGIDTTTTTNDDEKSDVTTSRRNNNSNDMTTIWCGFGKYVLHVVQDNDNDNNHKQTQWDDLPFQYAHAKQASLVPAGAEPKYLVWVDWNFLLQRLRNRRQPPTISFWVPPLSKNNDDDPETTNTTTQPASQNDHHGPEQQPHHDQLLTLDLSRFALDAFRHPVVQREINSLAQRMKMMTKSSGKSLSSSQQQRAADAAATTTPPSSTASSMDKQEDVGSVSTILENLQLEGHKK